jgi:putative flippase GtrA
VQCIFHRLPREFLAFGLIGALNTFFHSAAVAGLIELRILTPTLANVCAFVLTNQLSFFLNCRLTFHASPSLPLYRRFTLVSLTSLGVTVALSGFAEWMGWHYSIGLLLLIAVGPPLTFILQKHWTFNSIRKEVFVKSRFKNYAIPNQFGLIVFATCSLVAILAFSLTVNGLGPIDDHQFIRTTFQGKDFGAYVMPELGRFFPLTAQEYVFASKFFEPSPYLFQIINCIKILLCGALTFFCLTLTKARSCTVAVLWGVLLFSVGFANAAFRFHVGEINALILVLIFIMANLASLRTSNALSTKKNILEIFGIIAIFVAFFYKELIFVFAVAFSIAELVRHFRQKRTKSPWHLWLLLAIGIVYVVVYGYWRAIHTTGAYSNYHSAPILEVVRLFFINDPFMFLILLPLTAFRVYLASRDANRHSIYDSFLVAASAYVFAYLALGIFNTYYLLPAYGFAACGIGGVLTCSATPKRNRFIIVLSGLLALNTLPTAASDMQALKAITNNHYKFVQSLSEWLLLNPLPNSKSRNLVLNGVSPGNGVETIISLRIFLSSFDVPVSAFNVKYTELSDNKIVSNAYDSDAEPAYTAKIDDIVIFNPYQQTVAPPPLLTPSYREIFRSDSEWTFPRRTSWGWFDICILDQNDCLSGRPSDMRYTGYAALLKTRLAAVNLTELPRVNFSSYRVGPLIIGSRVHAGTTFPRDVIITNTGDETWPADGTLNKLMLVNLAYVWVDEDGKVALEGSRASFQEPIQKSDVVKVSIVIKTPDRPGNYRLIISPVQEGNRWFYSGDLSNIGKEIEVY